jgi:hypothetical protein
MKQFGEHENECTISETFEKKNKIFQIEQGITTTTTTTK